MEKCSCVDFLANPRQLSALPSRGKFHTPKKFFPSTIAPVQVFDFIDFRINRRLARQPIQR